MTAILAWKRIEEDYRWGLDENDECFIEEGRERIKEWE